MTAHLDVFLAEFDDKGSGKRQIARSAHTQGFVS